MVPAVEKGPELLKSNTVILEGSFQRYTSYRAHIMWKMTVNKFIRETVSHKYNTLVFSKAIYRFTAHHYIIYRLGGDLIAWEVTFSGF